MSMTDPIADFLTRIRNGLHAGHDEVVIPHSKMKAEMARILQEQGYIELQQKEWADGGDVPTRSHHFFSGVPYHHVVGKAFDAARLGSEFVEELHDDRVV